MKNFFLLIITSATGMAVTVGLAYVLWLFISVVFLGQSSEAPR